MNRVRRCWQLALALLFVIEAQPARAAEVPCTKIVTTVNHQVTRRIHPDLSELAKKLDTQVSWVEACLKAYGRRYRRPGIESDAGREAVMQGYETGRDEEIEDLDDPDEPDRR